MEPWLPAIIIFLVIGAIVGNLSLLKRSARPMRKKSLNDLKETIPGSKNLTANESPKQEKDSEES